MDILNEQINNEVTAQNVKRFLQFKLPRVLRLANQSPSVLQSPVINDMPLAHDGKNHNENKMIRYLAARELIMSVSNALQHCSQNAFLILKAKHVEMLTDWQVQIKLNYSHSTYYRMKIKAYNEFADCFELQKAGLDLHAYKEK